MTDLDREVTVPDRRLGKLAVRQDDRTLQLARYLDAAAVLPHVPNYVLWGRPVRSFPMYANDRFGDCTCAAAGHMVQIWTGNAGALVTPSEQDVLDLYWSTGSADDGRNCIDILNCWRQHGLGAGGHQVEAWVQVNHRNPAELAAAHYLFGGLYIGVNLPLSAQTQKVWKVVPDPGDGSTEPGSWGGHCVPFSAHYPEGWTSISWGQRLSMTQEFFSRYCDEAYAVLSPDWINKAGVDPSGIKLADLRRDLAVVSR